MGLLDDAIREHLELRRKHGANEDDLARQEKEALAPARREVPVAPEPEEEPDFLLEDGFHESAVDDRGVLREEQETMIVPPPRAEHTEDEDLLEGDQSEPRGELVLEDKPLLEEEPTLEPEPLYEPESIADREPPLEQEALADGEPWPEEHSVTEDPDDPPYGLPPEEELTFEEGFEPQAGPPRMGEPGLEEDPDTNPEAPGQPPESEGVPLEEVELVEEVELAPYEEPALSVDEVPVFEEEPVFEEAEVVGEEEPSESDDGPPPGPDRRSDPGGLSRVVPDFEDGARPGGIDAPPGADHDLDFDE